METVVVLLVICIMAVLLLGYHVYIVQPLHRHPRGCRCPQCHETIRQPDRYEYPPYYYFDTDKWNMPRDLKTNFDQVADQERTTTQWMLEGSSSSLFHDWLQTKDKRSPPSSPKRASPRSSPKRSPSPIRSPKSLMWPSDGIQPFNFSSSITGTPL